MDKDIRSPVAPPNRFALDSDSRGVVVTVSTCAAGPGPLSPAEVFCAWVMWVSVWCDTLGRVGLTSVRRIERSNGFGELFAQVIDAFDLGASLVGVEGVLH